MAIIIGALTVRATGGRFAGFTVLLRNYNNITVHVNICRVLRFPLSRYISNMLLNILTSLLTTEGLINAIYIWIAGVAGDASANRYIADDLAIGIGAARAWTRILTFRSDAG